MRWDTTQNIYTKYYYDGLTVIAESKKVGEGSWSWDKIMTFAPRVIGNILNIWAYVGGEWIDEYYHYEALGNVIMTTLSDETPSGAMFEQDAYGNVMVGAQSGYNYHLTTKEYDSHPQLYYFWQRWYDPLFGIFIKDILLPRYLEHPFNFCNQNPLTKVDPKGLVPRSESTCYECCRNGTSPFSSQRGMVTIIGIACFTCVYFPFSPGCANCIEAFLEETASVYLCSEWCCATWETRIETIYNPVLGYITFQSSDVCVDWLP